MDKKTQDIAERIASAAMAELEQAIADAFGAGYDAGKMDDDMNCALVEYMVDAPSVFDAENDDGES